MQKSTVPDDKLTTIINKNHGSHNIFIHLYIYKDKYTWKTILFIEGEIDKFSLPTKPVLFRSIAKNPYFLRCNIFFWSKTLFLWNLLNRVGIIVRSFNRKKTCTCVICKHANLTGLNQYIL